MRSQFPALAIPVALLALATPSRARAADPTVAECLSASNLSVKLRSERKLRQSRAELLVCTSGTCPADVREECSRRMGLLTAAIPSVVFEVRDAAGREQTAVKVSMDGEVVADHLDGTALNLDPGSHRFTFELAGQPPAVQTLILHEGDKNRRAMVVVGSPPPSAEPPAPSPPPALPPPGTSVADPAREPPDTAAPADGGQGVRRAGLFVGGAGLLGLAVGGAFGGLTFSSWGSANSACPSHMGCSTQAANDRTNALTFGAVSTVSFIAGGVLLAGGITLYVAGLKTPSPNVGLQLTPGSVGVAGRF
jgi:hypothetical protein